MASEQLPVRCNFNGVFKEEGCNLKYVGGSCRLSFIGLGDTIDSLRALFFKYMNTSPESCKIALKCTYGGDINKLIDVVDDDDVRNLCRLYKSHDMLMELYAVSNVHETEVPTCDPDDIDEVLTDSQLQLLITGRCQDPHTSTPLKSIQTIGSSSYPILIDDADAAINDGAFITTVLQEEPDSDVTNSIVAASLHGLYPTYSALDVVPLRRSDPMGQPHEQFDLDVMEEDLIVNSANMDADFNVAELGDVYEGQIYKSQADYKRAMTVYAMKKGFEYLPTKCNDRKITARCRVPECPWRIKARIVPGSSQWWVKKLDNHHTCNRAIGGLGHRNCNAGFIASIVREQVIANEKYTPKMIQTEILRQHGVKISYCKAYRAKERINLEVRGDFEGSFADLPSYMRELRSGDSEACLQLKYQDQGRFHRFFWAFGAAIRAFRSQCRPLLGLDGTFLTGKYRGALLTASCIDGNNCILPLAWAVVEGENRYSWYWFLEQLRDGVVEARDVMRSNNILTIMSDRQKGLIEAVADVFPDAAHGYCMYHLSTNLPHAPKNTPAWKRFWAAARAYTVREFNEHMEKMKDLNPEQYKYVLKLPRHRWATHCFLGRRYSMLTSNCAETINSVIRHLKGLPITYLVEQTRKKTASYFYLRKSAGEKMTGDLTPYAEKILASSREAARFFTPNPSTDVLFQVIAPDSTEVVDLSKKTCSCKRWDIDGIPCNHAMVAIGFRGRNPNEFVEEWFKTETYKATYNDYVPPTRGKEQWPQLQGSVARPRPPNVRIQPGRRKAVRRESISNGAIKKRCGTCQRWGHNKRSCKNPPIAREKKPCDTTNAHTPQETSGRRHM